MKRIKFLIVLAGICSTSFLHSCIDVEDDPAPKQDLQQTEQNDHEEINDEP